MWSAPFGARRDCQLWLLEFPPLSVDTQQIRRLSQCRVTQTQLQVFWAFFRRQSPIHLFSLLRLRTLPDYPVGRVWESSGVIKGLSSSIGKQSPPREPGGSYIRSLHRIAHSLCRLGQWSQRFSGRSAHRRGRLTADQPDCISGFRSS